MSDMFPRLLFFFWYIFLSARTRCCLFKLKRAFFFCLFRLFCCAVVCVFFFIELCSSNQAKNEHQLSFCALYGFAIRRMKTVAEASFCQCEKGGFMGFAKRIYIYADKRVVVVCRVSKECTNRCS